MTAWAATPWDGASSPDEPTSHGEQTGAEEPADGHDTEAEPDHPVDDPPEVPPATYAMPVRIEPRGAPAGQAETDEPDDPDGPDDSAKTGKSGRRRRRRLPLVLALVAVLVLGVAAGVPQVASRLGLPWADPLPSADPPEPIRLDPALRAATTDNPGPSPAGVRAQLSGPASASDLGTFSGTVLDPRDGTVLWEKDANKAAVPASATKLLTAAAVLFSMDPGKQLSTKVVAGSEPGTAVLIGGGDPTLSSLPVGEESVYPGAAHLDELVEQLQANSNGQIDRIVLDESRYADDRLAKGWAPGDVRDGYIAPVAPAMLDGGRADPTAATSQRTTEPGQTLATELADRLGAQFDGGAAGSAPQDAEVLGEVASPPVSELVDTLLSASDNMLGETLAREVALAAGEQPTFAGGAKATLDVLRQNGFDVSGIELSDGSGLSTQNRITPKLLAEVLAAAAAPLGGEGDPRAERTAKLRPLLGGVPVAGGTGTLADRYHENSSEAGRGWVRAKTGTLSGVNTLAGTVLDSDNQVLVFALMSADAEQEAGRAALDDVAASLRACGCR
ncbi:D-alanyl-D-alanine carboxypeptidase/D-alanyl-D-alanine-endopeptidase (penicillin-binding protein 4) [Tamaricihabitans halophyticus]|uniref:D-alanyl-D-alanine carboxypeptidase/D-alanyl-D-alanine-endopeptidase (Penicillin-binding protein 4) n=1 Tax=Tamaricihabitans halophyticus TaxID=1262583 RepID=A0A4R2R207_9PSEU|nr:D-alanyl-D-alanine carboxypeptidase/D-alanyl-D-alanine-endopeptidase (penicillin-binding protein 4) [Tamaricihabitans halophyticus]